MRAAKIKSHQGRTCYSIAVQSKSHQPYVATEHLQCCQDKCKDALSIKSTLESKDLTQKEERKNVIDYKLK